MFVWKNINDKSNSINSISRRKLQQTNFDDEIENYVYEKHNEENIPIICQVKEVLYEHDPLLNLTSSSEFHCIENITDDIYVLEKLPQRFLKRYQSILRLGNTWIQLERHQMNISMAKISMSSRTEIRILNLISSLRLALPFTFNPNRGIGTKKILIVKVSSIDSKSTISEHDMSDAVFGTYGDKRNLKSQYDACSYGQLDMVPANGFKIENGVLNLHLMVPARLTPAPYLQYIAMATARMKAGPFRPRFDHVMLCLPPDALGTWVAYAYINSFLSVYKDKWCTYISSQMHEVGHNLGLDHAGIPDNEYGDTTGMMGFSYEIKNWPRKCFNAEKSWNLGWYKDRHRTIDARTLTTWGGRFIGIPSYNDTNVRENEDFISIVKIRTYRFFHSRDVYIMFNEKKTMNFDTSRFPNSVTIVRGKAGGKSSSIAGLRKGEKQPIEQKGPFKNIIVEVCSLTRGNKYTGEPMNAFVSIYKDDGINESLCNPTEENDLNEALGIITIPPENDDDDLLIGDNLSFDLI